MCVLMKYGPGFGVRTIGRCSPKLIAKPDCRSPFVSVGENAAATPGSGQIISEYDRLHPFFHSGEVTLGFVEASRRMCAKPLDISRIIDQAIQGSHAQVIAINVCFLGRNLLFGITA